MMLARYGQQPHYLAIILANINTYDWMLRRVTAKNNIIDKCAVNIGQKCDYFQFDATE
jgi:hypothetical protein